MKPTTSLALRNNGNATSPGATITRKRRKRLGRRGLLTPQLQKRICALLAKGNTVVASCDHCGISESVYYDWCEQRPQFLQATQRARGKARIKLVKIIDDATKIDWKAAAWKLSHIWPNEYSETARLNIDTRFCGVLVLPEREQLPP